MPLTWTHPCTFSSLISGSCLGFVCAGITPKVEISSVWFQSTFQADKGTYFRVCHFHNQAYIVIELDAECRTEHEPTSHLLVAPYLIIIISFWWIFSYIKDVLRTPGFRFQDIWSNGHIINKLLRMNNGDLLRTMIKSIFTIVHFSRLWK